MEPKAVARALRLVCAMVALSFFAVETARAQSISAHSGNTSGSTGNTGDGSTSVRSSRQTETATGSTFRSRFAWNISADVGVFSTGDRSGNAQHNMSFNVTAPGGYRLDIVQQRNGIIQRNNDASGCSGQADTSGVTGSQGGGSVTSGSLSLGDPGGFGSGGSTTNTPIGQTQNASIGGVSNGGAVGHTLTFTWNGSVRSNSCEAAVRQGEGTSVTGCGACEYPGSPSRTQNTDGHFVTVTLVNLCGNGVVDSGSPWLEDCDTASGGVCCDTNCQFRPASFVCRGSAGVCDPQETCTGTSQTCPGNSFSPGSTVCRGTAGSCDIAENCTGTSAACPGNGFVSAGTTCRGSGGVCDVVETCSGTAAACPGDGFASSATVCRGAVSTCDVTENCTGTSAACPPNGFASSATVCRGSAGICDVAENCTGTSSVCPGNGFQSSATVCRGAAGVCDAVENCTGTGAACPADLKTGGVCRAATDVCDVAETCDTVSDDCPADGFAPSSTTCRGSAGVCDVAESCTGSGPSCPSDAVATSATVCRSTADVCDVAENCDGSSVDCPADAFEPASTVCRGVADVCDVSESCTGSGPSCPADAFEPPTTVCRGATDVCDVTETCTGGAAACPTDAVEPPTTVCRPAANTADAPETCDGSLKACPADLCTPSGTPCDDSDFCTQTDASNGVDGPGCQCVGANPVDCDDVNPCTDDLCDSQGGGFLCVYDNNGICIGPNCGNFQVDAGDGETCDPPNLAPDPVTGQTMCRLDCTRCGDGVIQANNTETCDDGNTISGCRTDQPQRPLDDCLNNCNEAICADPARISFGKPGRPDLYYFHGRLIADETVDFANKHFVIELRDNTGAVIYRASLVNGSIQAVNAKASSYKNRTARDSGGVYQLKSKAGVGFYILSVKAYGDLSGAVADMSTHVYVGSDEWVVRGLWRQQGTKGWKLGKHDALLPVQ